MDNADITFLEFAWDSLTEHQKFRIKVKYDLVNSLNGKNKYGEKTATYTAIADKYGYTVKRIKDIAIELNTGKNG